METSRILADQRAHFETGVTKPLAFRLMALDALRQMITENEAELCEALKRDLNKAPYESYLTEIGIVLSEISYHRRRLARWMKPRRLSSPLSVFPARSYMLPEPYGVALIIAPWNYPLQLCLLPLVGAISAGNCAIIKPSAYAPATSAILARLLSVTFPVQHIAVVQGGRAENIDLLEQRFDYIFFTGSVAVGKEVMKAASRYLTPATLELGGKSPVIIDQTADLKLAARRIACGKLINAGQTCVAPDYLLIHSSVKKQFIQEYRAAVKQFFPNGDMSDLPLIINEKHFMRVTGLMNDEKAALGGEYDALRRYVSPTLLPEVTPNSPVMQEEIFGPVLPILTFEQLNEAIDYINSREKPLALYIFSTDRAVQNKVLSSCSFGGGCVNDTLLHVATNRLPFGGVGASGMGSYHGKASFNTFTHYKSILYKSANFDNSLRYHPYTERKLRLIKKFLK